MNRSWWSKFLVLLVLTVMAGVYVYPSLAGLDLEKTKFPFKQKINLGLDLQGGLYMVMGVDFNKVYKDVLQRQAGSLESYLRDKKLGAKSVKLVTENMPADDPRIFVEANTPADVPKIQDAIKQDYWVLRLAGEEPGRIELGLSREFRADVKDRTINQSIEVIRNRIDEFGVTEPVIASQGDDRVIIELPGVKDIDRAKDLIGRTARLEFKIVADKAMEPGQVLQLVEEAKKEKNIEYKPGQKFSDYAQAINLALKGKIPENTEIAFERSNTPGQEAQNVPYLLYSKIEVTGDDLQDANVALDPETRRPNVAFEMNPRGAALFGEMSEKNVGNRLAIVLDNIVASAPVLQSKISDRGQITLGQGNGEQLMKEAKDLAIVLRAGALPAQLEFLEQRVTGPSLGADSIRKGTLAALVGSLAVFLLVILYYRLSGVIATVSLVLNVLFILAILVGLEATLTLPGIAGIALTVGIAVDSNIIIYERIREELRAGKRAHGAVEAGFQKALATIVDSNLTSAAAATVLLIYGTGPIKGFAVTLLIGIVTTLFSAVFVCKLLFDLYLKRLESRSNAALSI